MQTIRSVIFDLGGVLLDIDFKLTEKAFEEIGVTDFHQFFNQFHSDDLFKKLETGMEDWQKPENVALRAELQRWYDHREETSMEQRRADASALMAQVEARQAAGKISETSAALAKLMLLQGAPSDDPQHAARLVQGMGQQRRFRGERSAHAGVDGGFGLVARPLAMGLAGRCQILAWG